MSSPNSFSNPVDENKIASDIAASYNLAHTPPSRSNLQGHSFSVENQAAPGFVSIAIGKAKNIYQMFVSSVVNSYWITESKEEVSSDLKNRCRNLKDTDVDQLREKFLELSDKYTSSEPEIFYNDLATFFRQTKDVNFGNVSSYFTPDSKLSSLFQEIHQVKTQFLDAESRGENPEIVLPPTMKKIFYEIRNYNTCPIEENHHFLEDLPPTLHALFLEIDHEVYTKISLEDVKNLFQKEIPLQYREYSKEILSIVANPNTDRAAATLSFATGFTAVALMGATLNQSSLLDPAWKKVLATLPLLTGSLGRFVVGSEADRKGGKQIIMGLLVTSLVGVAGLTTLSDLTDLATMEGGSGPDIGLGIFGATAGFGVATFPASMTISARSGKKSEAAKRQGVTGGLGNFTPGLAQILQGQLLGTLGLTNTYLMWLALGLTGTGLTYKYLNDSVYHQLKSKGVPQEKARKIATWMGQELFPGTETNGVVAGYKSLNPAQRKGLHILTLNYMLTFGGFLALTSTLPLYFKEELEMSQAEALTATGTLSLISSVSRFATGYTPLGSRGQLATDLGLAALAAGGTVIAASPSSTGVALPALLAMMVGDGVANYGVFRWMNETLSSKLGIAAGFVGAIGAFGALGIGPALGAGEDGEGFALFPAAAAVCFLANRFFMPKNFENLPQTAQRPQIEEINDTVDIELAVPQTPPALR